MNLVDQKILEDTKGVNSEDEKCRNIIETEKSRKESNAFYCIMNLMNTIIGAGVMVLPKSFTYAGAGLSILILAICAIIADFTAILLVKCSEMTGKYSYQKIVKVAFGTPGFVIITICQIIFPICSS
ncbi:hypothetical protein HZS_5350, partial [Henneguya salminicola]